MTIFIVLCAVMIVAAIALLIRPLLRKPIFAAEVTKTSPRIPVLVIVVLLPLATAGLYVRQSNWSWSGVDAAVKQQATAEDMVAKLEQRLKQSPDDVEGWLLLGRSYLTLDRAGRAVDAYQKAYDLSHGENLDAILGLGESLALTDRAAIQGRAGELFETALRRDPANPTALWYGAVTALVVNNLPLARQRMTTLLSLNPPQQVRDVLERQIQDIDEQLGTANTASAKSGTALETSKEKASKDAAGRSVQVSVAITPALAKGLDPKTPVFILARDGGGPPLAAVRRAVGDLPLVITLSDANAMIAGRNLSSVQQVQIVARISKSGAPQAQQGDFFGEISHSFTNSKTPSAVSITIDHVVP